MGAMRQQLALMERRKRAITYCGPVQCCLQAPTPSSSASLAAAALTTVSLTALISLAKTFSEGIHICICSRVHKLDKGLTNVLPRFLKFVHPVIKISNIWANNLLISLV